MKRKSKVFRPAVSFTATKYQMKKLRPISKLFGHGRRAAVLGQVYVYANTGLFKVGTMRFHYIPEEAALEINRAILSAARKYGVDIEEDS